MLSFRKKLFLSGTGLLAAFIIGLFLFLDHSVDAYLAEWDGCGGKICFLVEKFKIAILFFGGGTLILYSLLTWILFNHLSRPLQKITDHILSYSEGNPQPLVPLNSIQKGEFGKIANILNALNGKIKKQMDHLILARKETEEILDSLAEGVIAVDNQGKTIFANVSACKFLEVSRDTLLSIPLHCVEANQKELALQCGEAIQEVLQTSDPVQKNGNFGKRVPVHLELSGTPLPGLRGVILVIQDKSSDFKILDMGKDFIANASHELRTPITIIRGFAETLMDYPNLSPQTLCDISEKIVRTSHRLENLVKSLLTLADIENFSSDKLQITDFVVIVSQCRQFAMTAHQNSIISLCSELEKVPILGDAQLLDLAVTNLLENAVKYSPSPARIEMAIHKGNGCVELEIRDQGIGIPDADLPHIFNRFYTVDKARSRKSGGAGLGLSIVKTIIEKHMGIVTAKSQLGVGSTFKIRLPLTQVL